jgi:hypothetical protein
LIERIDKAIAKMESKIKGIPADEMVPDNPDYMKWDRLLDGFKRFRESVIKIDKMMIELGV